MLALMKSIMKAKNTVLKFLGFFSGVSKVFVLLGYDDTTLVITCKHVYIIFILYVYFIVFIFCPCIVDCSYIYMGFHPLSSVENKISK